MEVNVIVRSNYDKVHRCPAWSGPGILFAYPWERNLPECKGGSLSRVIDWESPFWGFKVYACPECGIKILPPVTRYLDPDLYAYKISRWPILFKNYMIDIEMFGFWRTVKDAARWKRIGLEYFFIRRLGWLCKKSHNA